MVLSQQTFDQVGSKELVGEVDLYERGGICAYDNTTLSTIIRFHKQERLSLLEDALFSLALQHWHDLELIIVVQNGSGEIETGIVELIHQQPWLVAPRYKVISVGFPEGVDGRSTLLNTGLAQATGRYVAFLDDDDVVYQHGYATLIKQLKEGKCAVAVGGCRLAKTEYKSNHWFVITKNSPFAWGRTRLDLFRENFIPINSYVIDRKRLDTRDLYFDDQLPSLEDYEFLLRLCAKYDFDFTKVDVPVCEYRVRLDGSNNLPYFSNAPLEAFAIHQEARDLINERKRSLTYPVPISELLDLHQSTITYKEENERLHQELAIWQEENQLLHRTASVVAARLHRLEQRAISGEEAKLRLQQRVTGYEREIEFLQQRVTGYEREIELLQQRVTGYEREIELLQQRVIGFEEETQRLQEKLNSSEEEKQRLHHSVISYEKEKQFEQARFPNSITRKTYAFWDRHPTLQRHISSLAHSAWRLYRRIKS